MQNETDDVVEGGARRIELDHRKLQARLRLDELSQADTSKIVDGP